MSEANGSASTDYRYCHDARGQLTGRGSTSSCTTSNVESFVFDDAGNRTQAVEAGVTRNFAYTAAGLLCDVETGSAASCTSGNIASDDAGRISDVAGWHYQYDAQGRLVSACEDADCVGTGFDRLDFTYDGEGHRTAITETPASGPVSSTVFRYQGSAIVAEERDGDPWREYVVDEAGTIGKVIVPAGLADEGTYLVTWNGHGDAMALWRIETDGSLTLANSYTYSTWGTPTTATHNSIGDLGFRFLYVGAHDVQWDDTFGLGLLYMHARHYSPSLGRFLQPDPSRLDEQLFVYAGNGPASRMDPDGTLATPKPSELNRCVAHPDECVVWASVSVWADHQAAKRFHDSGQGRRNAFRHCCWQALLTVKLGSAKATAWGDAHEVGAKHSGDSQVDQHNNRVGRRIGRAVKPDIIATRAYGAKTRDYGSPILRECNKAIFDGRLLHKYNKGR